MAQAIQPNNLSPALPTSPRAFRLSRPRHSVVIPAVQLAHSGLIATIGQNTPHDIHGYAADRFDIMERRDHLRTVLQAAIAYAKAIVSDTANLAPASYISDETGYLEDAESAVYAAFDKAVETLISDQAAE